MKLKTHTQYEVRLKTLLKYKDAQFDVHTNS